MIALTRSESLSLLPRIATGDERAVAECVSAFGPLVFMLARRWSTDAADAEDAVQEIVFDLPDEGQDHGERLADGMEARAVLDQLTPMQRRFIRTALARRKDP